MIRFDIPGMTCGGCVRSIVSAIHGVDAQAAVETDVETRSVRVKSGASRAALVEAIREAGYEAQAAA
ncbi:MAG: heavy-metal-associated domain-containing protein [Sphingopyxis sp.]|nr:heavy-metal-associated domain-containing protein [Sphingopyxis sp.]